MAAELPPPRAGELTLAAGLAQVPGYVPGAHVAALTGGEVNKSFRVETIAGQFVLRLHGSLAVASLGVDHIREGRLQAAAAAAGIAPAVVHVDAGQRFMICEYVDGRVWSAADFADIARLRQLGETFQKVHAVVPPIPAPFDLEALLRGFAKRVACAVPTARPMLAQWLAQAEISLRESGSAGRQATLFHSDPQHCNILERHGNLLLLDWEYAAVGDPLYDLACVLAYYPQAVPHAADLLAASGLAGQATLSMLKHTSWLYARLNDLWGRVLRIEADGAGVRLPTPAD